MPNTLGEPAYKRAFKYWRSKIKKALIVHTFYVLTIINQTLSLLALLLYQKKKYVTFFFYFARISFVNASVTSFFFVYSSYMCFKNY